MHYIQANCAFISIYYRLLFDVLVFVGISTQTIDNRKHNTCTDLMGASSQFRTIQIQDRNCFVNDSFRTSYSPCLRQIIIIIVTIIIAIIIIKYHPYQLSSTPSSKSLHRYHFLHQNVILIITILTIYRQSTYICNKHTLIRANIQKQ